MTNGSVESAKHVGDALSVFVVLGSLASILPPIAALLTIIWTLIRILESRTVQSIIRRVRKRD